MQPRAGITVFLIIALPTIIGLLAYNTWTNTNYYSYKSAKEITHVQDSFLGTFNEYLETKFRHLLAQKGLNISQIELSKCPKRPLIPGGPLKVHLKVMDFDLLEKQLSATNITAGGHWKPRHCEARHRIAVIVPYRNREAHLKIFLRHMHPFLQRQNLEYGIYVVEQEVGKRFNRGALLNIGFVMASKEYKYQCYFFHDIDNLPADNRIFYTCPEFPYHMASAVQKFGYKLPYEDYVGGVFAIRKEQFKTINGFSNVYFGWGAEDDDLWQRLNHAKLPIKRYVGGVFRFEAIPHKQVRAASDRMTLLNQARTRFDRDGLSNLNYTLISYENEKLFTHVKVQISKTLLRNVEK